MATSAFTATAAKATMARMVDFIVTEWWSYEWNDDSGAAVSEARDLERHFSVENGAVLERR